MKRRGARVQHMIALEITPMIDVVFLLIVFFMTTAQFARVTRTELDLPLEQGEQEEQPEEAGFVINIDASGSIIVAASTVTMVQLEDRLRDAIAEHPIDAEEPVKVLLRADRTADSAHLNRVVMLLQKLKLGASRIATEVPGPGTGR